MAQAYASSGDLGSARAELEKLLATDTRDTRLLQQLSKLAEEEGDLETAARYQKLHEELAPEREGQAAAGELYAKAGDIEEAQAVWSKAAAGKSQSFRVFRRDGQPARPTESRCPCSRSPRRCSAKTRTTGRHSTARAWPSSSSAGRRRPQRGSEADRLCPSATMRRAPSPRRKREPQLQAAGAPTHALRPRGKAMMPLEDRVGTSA